MGSSTADIFAKHGVTLSEDELMHYGKKGMKWGKRKARSNERKAANADRAAARAKTKTMTDDELKSAIARLKLEKEYKQLNAHEISTGQKLVLDILKDAGKQTAQAYVRNTIQSLTTNTPTKDAAETVKKAVKEAPKAKPAPMKLELAKRPGFE